MRIRDILKTFLKVDDLKMYKNKNYKKDRWRDRYTSTCTKESRLGGH